MSKKPYIVFMCLPCSIRFTAKPAFAGEAYEARCWKCKKFRLCKFVHAGTIEPSKAVVKRCPTCKQALED